MIKLVLSDPSKMDQTFSKVIKGAGKNIIAVLSSKPYYSIKERVEKDCKNKKCLFLDTVAESKGEDVVYLPAENLTALSIAINQAQQPFGGKVTVIFDSLTNLVIRNDPSILIKFFVFLLSRARDWDIDLVLVFPKEGVDEKLLSVIKQSADKVENK